MTSSAPQFSVASGWIENTPQRIMTVGAVVTVVGLGTWVSWLATGDYTLINAFFRYPNALFTFVICLVEVLLCLHVWRRLDKTDAMRGAWFWLFLASLAHLTGRTLAMPGSATVAATQMISMSELGRMVGGPLQMSLMLAGLSNVVLNCRRLRLLKRLQAVDYVLLAVVSGFLVRSFWVISIVIADDKPVTLTTAVLWTSDPLLLLLLAAAVLIRRSIAALGFGLLANCWRSFIVGIVLTSLGSASAWCLDCEVTPIWTSLGWYVWFVADSAFALGPAFQAVALEHARNRARVFDAFADLAFWRVP
jgi:hypothetical protein